MHTIVFACYAFVLFLFVFIAWKDLPKTLFIIPVFVGICASISTNAFAQKNFEAHWASIIAFLPILCAMTIWWIVKTIRPRTTTTLILMTLLLIGCNRYVEPEAGDTVSVLAKVEELKVDGNVAHFKVRLEGRTLIYNEDYLEIRQSQIESLHNDDQIMIVKRGLNYFWTTGGKLIPFN